MNKITKTFHDVASRNTEPKEKKLRSFRELLNRSFATIECNPVTGAPMPTIVDGHKIVTGQHFLAPFEIDALEKALRASIANKEQ